PIYSTPCGDHPVSFSFQQTENSSSLPADLPSHKLDLPDHRGPIEYKPAMASQGEARAESPTGSPRTASTSLQAAATLNASLHHEPSQRSSSSVARNQPSPNAGRRRSAVLMNLQLNDPGIPAPGEMQEQHSLGQHASPHASPGTADPHHHRAPSLGELHQELEAEQEAHVNRLLQMIRQQQLELQRLQSPHNQSSADESAISERSGFGTPQPLNTHAASPSMASGATVGSYPRSPVLPHPRSSFDMARADLHRRSRTPSRGASPRLRSTSISAESGDWALGGGRDESAFYQAETQMLVRENQMLRHRIRELEKQLTDASGSSASTEPPVPSHLTRSQAAVEGEAGHASAPKET
ncbi:hypothetical protein S40288_06222, partial [Stachybotrys chartarum IBT 40288]